MENKNELKPCPFCGKKATLNMLHNPSRWYVACVLKCCTQETSSTKKEAIQKWNNRISKSTSNAEFIINERYYSITEYQSERRGNCPKCRQTLIFDKHRNFCGICGQAIRWRKII